MGSKIRCYFKGHENRKGYCRCCYKKDESYIEPTPTNRRGSLVVDWETLDIGDQLLNAHRAGSTRVVLFTKPRLVKGEWRFIGVTKHGRFGISCSVKGYWGFQGTLVYWRKRLPNETTEEDMFESLLVSERSEEVNKEKPEDLVSYTKPLFNYRYALAGGVALVLLGSSSFYAFNSHQKQLEQDRKVQLIKTDKKIIPSKRFEVLGSDGECFFYCSGRSIWRVNFSCLSA